MSGRQTRAREPVNYSETVKSGGAVPAWVKAQLAPGSASQQRSSGGKENERGEQGPRSHGQQPAGKQHAKPAATGKEKASKSVPARGRDAGVTKLPILDRKQQPQDGSGGKGSGGKAKKVASAGGADPAGDDRVLVTKDVPGLAGVKQKRLEPRAAAAAAAAAEETAAEPAAPPSGKQPGSSGKKHKRGAAEAEQQQQQQQPAAKRPRKSGGSKSAPAAAAAPREEPRRASQGQQPAQAEQQPQQQAGPSAAAGRGRRPSAAVSGEAATDDDGVLQRVARAVDAAVRAEAEAATVPATPDCQRCQHFSDNFAALLREYQGLQREYEALKAAKLSEEVEDLLKEHNRSVTEHGAKAAELANHWRVEADKRQQEAEQYAALLERCRGLEGELLAAQAEVIDSQAAHQFKDTRIAELETRIQLLERHVRLPEVHDQGMQTDGPAAHSAGVQAPSPVSPGVQMYEARGMIPEGAPGTVYKKGRPSGAAGAAPDASYSLPATTAALAQAAQLAAAQQEGVGSLQSWQQQAAVPAAAAAPAAGSDMELTGEGLEQVLLPVSGRIAHAAVASGGGRVAARRASLPLAPAAKQVQQQQPAIAAPAQRPGSAQLTAESEVNRAALPAQRALPQPAPQGRARRLSAPPAYGGGNGNGGFSFNSGAPLERQLQFTSTSNRGLQAVPEEEQEEGHAQTEGTVPVTAPPPPREGAVTMLGFEATPCKGGKYIFSERASGFVFELGPAPPGSPGSDEDEAADDLCYRCLQVGALGEVLPAFLHAQIVIEAKFRPKLMQIITEALASYPANGGGSQQ